VILVELGIERADLALAKRIIQSRVNLIRSDIHAWGSRPVDHEVLGKTSRLLIGSNVSQLRLLPQFGNHSFGPCIEFRWVGVFQCVLELVPAGTIVYRQVLDWLHVEMYAFHFPKLGLKSSDYSGRVDLAFGKWLQVDLNASAIQGCIRSIHSNEGRQAGDCRVLKNDLREFLLLQGHRLERDGLRSLRNTLNNAYILCGE
jgi:hypothetical protein